jgi:hypothetical protein
MIEHWNLSDDSDKARGFQTEIEYGEWMQSEMKI